MLDIALQFLRDELKSYIVNRTGSADVDVKLTRIVDDTGKYAFPEETIAISLVNLEEERTIKEHLPKYSNVDGQQIVQEPELRLNLYLLFAGNFRQYDEALKYLSYILTYFQSHSAFNSTRNPGLDVRIRKLLMELQSVSHEQMNQIWAFIGAKHLPCVMYKARLVTLQDVEPAAVQPPIFEIDTNARAI